MKALFLKEIHSFFSSITGYIAIGIFLLCTGFFLWIFPEYSVLEYGFATLDAFFELSPMLLLLIIPAVTMRSFSEEKSVGTIEWLLTKPLTDMQLILGKYAAAVCLAVFALVPTVIYYISIYQLGMPVGNIDTGGVLGSYIGLLFLVLVFSAIGIFTSCITQNQMVAFLVAVGLSAFMFWGFGALSEFPFMIGNTSMVLKQIGIQEHYSAVSRGVVDTRDVMYFGSVVMVFLLLTQLNLASRKWK